MKPAQRKRGFSGRGARSFRNDEEHNSAEAVRLAVSDSGRQVENFQAVGDEGRLLKSATANDEKCNDGFRQSDAPSAD
jgi:hypothetical protein